MERIRKCYQETGDVHDRPRSSRPGKKTARDNSLLVRLSKARPMSTASQLQEEWTPATPVLSRTVRRILAHNCHHGCIAAQKPVLNKRQLWNCVAFAKAHRLMEGWTAQKWRKIYFSDESSGEPHPKRRQYCQRLSGAHLDPRFTQKTVKFGGGKIMVWGYIQYGGAREICKVDVNRFLPPSAFPTTRGVRFLPKHNWNTFAYW